MADGKSSGCGGKIEISGVRNGEEGGQSEQNKYMGSWVGGLEIQKLEDLNQQKILATASLAYGIYDKEYQAIARYCPTVQTIANGAFLRTRPENSTRKMNKI